MKSIIIAAPHSGSGKTTITLGLMECLGRRGLKVAPFKVGPDFIDPGYHQLVTGRPSVNLDGWMCPPSFVRDTFLLHCQDADIAVIEGVMGLFDGIGGASEEGSTAQAAKITGAPVILVVDAKGQARSTAPLVKGFAEFDRDVKVAGVIFNNVGSAAHGRILREAVAAHCPETAVVGCIPKDGLLHIPSRHLGLFTADENPLSAEFLDHLAEVLRENLDLDLLCNLSLRGHLSLRGQVYTSDKAAECECMEPTPVKVAVARDEAFCFVYEDNLRLLREAGAELVEFSPLAAERLPEGVAGIYLPGGYPELFAETLAANVAMLQAIRAAIEAGAPVYAECGGFIYLSQGVKSQDLASLAGVFPVAARMLPKRKALGYREVELVADTILGPAGTVARGHEFHYSEMAEMPAEVERLYRVRRQGDDLGMEGYGYKNCLASYIHFHFGSCPDLARTFVENCRKYKKQGA